MYLYRLAGGKIADYDEPLATNRKAVVGDNTLAIPAGYLLPEKRSALLSSIGRTTDLRYFEAGDVTVAAEQEADSIAIQETSLR